jgi:hypothetical protein
VGDRTLSEQQLHTRLDQIRAGIEKLEYEALAAESAGGWADHGSMSPMRYRLSSAEAELRRLQDADDDIWDEIRENLQSALDALANDIDGKAPSFGDT